MNIAFQTDSLTPSVRYAIGLVVQNWSNQHTYPQPERHVQGYVAPVLEQHTPLDLTILERDLYKVNPDDHEWRKQYFRYLPHYLAKYFAQRYTSIYQKKGRKAANVYLRETVGEKIQPRVKKVMKRYRKLYRHQTSLHREMIMAEMDRDDIRDLAYKMADVFSEQLQQLSDLMQDSDDEYEVLILKTFCVLSDACKAMGFEPPYNKPEYKLSPEEAECGILRLVCKRFWESRLKKARNIMREHLAIAVGQVQQAASAYCSRDCLSEWKEQKRRTRDFIKNMAIFDEDTQEEVALEDMVYKSVSNPAIRRTELMVRMRGFENISEAMALSGLFFTLTAPSKYHSTRKKGGFIEDWLGNNPRDAQQYLTKTWAKIRAKLARTEFTIDDPLRVFGFRVVEPHHDGTPHWHLLLFMKPEHQSMVRDIFIQYAIEEDIEELLPKKTKRHTYVGQIDYRARCDVKPIDPSKGSATGYIAKYISKNIDGYAMDGELDIETGKDLKEMSSNVTAWASRWRIRQFQSIGGAPVSTYRELRRYANNDKGTFMSYIAMLNSKEQADVFSEMFPPLPADLQGPQMNYQLMGKQQVWEVFAGKYQPSLKTDIGCASNAMTFADTGDWAGYVTAQGGPFVKRKDLIIRNDYDEIIMGNDYGELVKKIQGFCVVGEAATKTRLRNWKIQPKSKSFEEGEANALRPEGASRSSVNNCTPSAGDQLKHLIRSKLRHRDIDDHDHVVNTLVKGGRINIGNDRIMKLAGNYYADGRYHQPELIEVDNDTNIWSGWNGWEGEEKTVPVPDAQQEQCYQQPDLITPFHWLEEFDDVPLI